MNKSLRYQMIKSAQQRINMQKKYKAQLVLLEQEIKTIEGDNYVQRRKRV